ncbi:hypothetical protein [Aquamicrobium sp. LC103]|uniref:hypothetical protein n=1 Tax=Aquamicrobium sp. LC103 TaxID=1120658 RepID=UPI00069C1371|nr:hypothetical protein [Aquamicrobium sp. LC103]TKT69714.1 hypothetical protein XW59_026635 [Aquamicrobium sp. LC103]
MSQTKRWNKSKGGKAPIVTAKTVEWIIGVASGVLVCSGLVYFGYKAISSDGRPPSFTATMESVENIDGDFHVTVLLRNHGDETAADVVVRGTLDPGPGGVEEREIQFTYVPAGSSRRGALLFSTDPATAARFEFEVVGYTEP